MNDSHAETRHAVAVVVVENEQFLVIRRSLQVRAPGKICFPGGHIEAGESEQDAVRREMQEELAIVCQPQRVVWRSRTPWGTDVAWWLATRADQTPPTANPAEVDEVQWLSTDEMLNDLDLLESNREFLAALGRNEIDVSTHP